MNILSADQAKSLLIEEYPQFEHSNLTIVRQFKAADGRMFNTFLIESDADDFKRFIAKGVVHEQHPLEPEWFALKLLQERNADAPKLLLPDHMPKHFLLLEFIDGLNAAVMVDNGKDVEKVFREVGVATGKVHSIRVDHFGDLLNPDTSSWKDYLEGKIAQRLNGIKHLIPESLFKNTEKLFGELKPIIEKESLEEARLLHRDIYLENFILKNGTDHAILIDYGMAIGGRPFYDLGKFYILELYKLPEYRDTFLQGYREFISLPDDFSDRMRLYIMKEALGMINFFNNVGYTKGEKHAITVLDELSEDKGVIPSLLNS